MQATVYGLGTNDMGACTYASNGAQALDLPWASAPSNAPQWPAGVQTTYIAMNNIDWGLSAACGTCLWFKSQGARWLWLVFCFFSEPCFQPGAPSRLCSFCHCCAGYL